MAVAKINGADWPKPVTQPGPDATVTNLQGAISAAHCAIRLAVRTLPAFQACGGGSVSGRPRGGEA
jgi:hypothetical protein